MISPGIKKKIRGADGRIDSVRGISTIGKRGKKNLNSLANICATYGASLSIKGQQAML